MTDGDNPITPQGWSLSAKLTPADADDEAPDATDRTEVVPPEWSTASEDVRTLVKWMVGALGAIGAVLFAKGLITTPDLNWTDDQNNLIAAWCLGTLGLVGLGWLIFEAVNVLRPSAFELGNLPTGYIRLVDADPSFYLPGGVPDVATFIADYKRLRLETATWQMEVTSQQIAVDHATKAGDQEAKAAASAALARATIALSATKDALAVYVEVRQTLVSRATYWSAAQGFTTADLRIITAAALAAFAGIGYQLVLAPAGPEDGDEATPAATRIAQLSQTDTPAGQELWTQLDLAKCQADPETPVIDVVVTDGDGSANDPWTVTTIPEGDCLARSFTVIGDVALVSEATTSVITYSPSPEPTPTESDYPPRP